MLKVVLGLGGNIGDSITEFRNALGALGARGTVVAVSRLWKTRPVGPEQPEYSNAAAVVLWPSGPRDLLETCRRIESAAGRNRAGETRWGPRTLDLDVLLAEQIVCVGPGLELPHPRFHERRFALEPANEIAPYWRHFFLSHTVEELTEKMRLEDPDGILGVDDFDPEV